jgi:exodeoxyribonuclease VII large subunit
MSKEGFFEFHQRIKGARAPKPDSKKTVPTDGQPAALTVTQLTAMVDKAVKTLPNSVTVRGEVSNYRGKQSSGHIYFTLKDDSACLNAVIWRDAAARVKFEIEDGMEVIATGRVVVFAPQGKYQLNTIDLQAAGRGALELALRQLQAKLSAEGLFAADRKRPIPHYPRRIVMITSRSTAALQDMLKVLRRLSFLKLFVYHVPVQGEGSGEKIVAAISHLNEKAKDIGGADVILLARGGGSLEDLWAFNEEIVARAMAASRIPIVTGIGHEIDTSIADLVADHHAHTPTQAAQIVVQNWIRAADELIYSQTRLNRGLRQTALGARQRLVAVERHEMFRRPMDRIQMLRQLLDDRQRGIALAMAGHWRDANRRWSAAHTRFQEIHPRHAIALANQKLHSQSQRLRTTFASMLQSRAAKVQSFEQQLNALSPQAVLSRGYAIVTLKKTGEIVRSVSQLTPGDKLRTQLKDGQVESVVQDSKQMSLFE